MASSRIPLPRPRRVYSAACARKAIEAADIVSFDIFDTVVVRPFAAPDHLFWLLEVDAAPLLGRGAPPFRQLRIESERRARATSNLPEVTLEEIYAAMGRAVACSPERLLPLMEMELALEHRLCRRRECVGKLFEHAQQLGKQIVFTSDTYFDRRFVEKLLHTNGFGTDPTLLLSAEKRLTKHAGPLFDELRRHGQAAGQRILHIGDNFRSDCLMAWRHGIPSFHVASPIHNLALEQHNLEIVGARRLPLRSYARARLSSMNAHLSGCFNRPEPSLMAGLSANRFFDTAASGSPRNFFLQRWDVLGYRAFGPLLLGFSRWLLEQFRRHGIRKAHFLSRDGRIMKMAFDMVASGHADTIETTYTYCSRRALNFARITALDHQAMRFLCDSSSPTSVGDHLARIQFDAAEFSGQIRAAGFSGADQLVTPGDRKRLEDLFRSLAPQIIAAAARERQDLLAYYTQIGLVDRPDVAVIDIGWWGTMYRSLAELITTGASPTSIRAFYFGTFAEADQLRLAGLPHDAYFIRYGEPLDLFHGIKECIEIVELFFSAPHGTFIKITQGQDGPEPVLDTNDCTELRLNAITEMQRGALDFLRDALELGSGLTRLRLSPYDLSLPLRCLLATPQESEIRQFETLVHYQDVGRNSADREIVVQPSTWQLLFFPLAFARQLGLSYWRAGTIRRLPAPARLYLKFLVRVREAAQNWL